MGFLDGFKEKIGIDSAPPEDVLDEVEEHYERSQGDSLEVARTSDYESPYDGESSGTVKRRPRTPDVKRAAATGSPLREVAHTTDPRILPRTSGQALVHNARPTSFNDCGLIADRYKGGQPVIIDLNSIPFEEQRRFLDFAAGLIYGMNGEISKVSAGIYLLTPHGSQVSDSDRARFTPRNR